MPCGPRLTGCRSACRHRQLVEEYRLYRHSWELLAEEAANGWGTEYDEFTAHNPAPTFKEWLIGHRTRQEAPA